MKQAKKTVKKSVEAAASAAASLKVEEVKKEEPLQVRLKAAYKDHVVGFNNSAAPLGGRQDLYLLAIDGLKSGDATILDLFEPLPPLIELMKMKVEIELGK